MSWYLFIMPPQVHMVVGRCNMWANTQAAAAPWALDWRLGRRAAWLPFFGGANALPRRHLGTLQPPLRCWPFARCFWPMAVASALEPRLSCARHGRGTARDIQT